MAESRENYNADGTPIHQASDSTLRKSRYGSGRQPWDDICDAGWGPAFAAGNVVKNLRRDKEPEHSLESARWYYARLQQGAAKEGISLDVDSWHYVLWKLKKMLTPAELALLQPV